MPTFTSGRHRGPGRHRRPRTGGAPAYLTAATVIAFTASGLRIPDAVGHARSAPPPSGALAAEDPARNRSPDAAALRDALGELAEQRASRVRVATAEAARLARRAAKEARERAEAARPKWVPPVVGYRLTAGYGEVGLWSSAHTGQDFAAPGGTSVRSIGDGRIVFAGWDGAYGNKVVVEHPDGTLTWYAHLLSFVRTSGTVRAGDVIARVGSTGNSTGDHVHLEVRPLGAAPVAPLTWLRQRGVAV